MGRITLFAAATGSQVDYEAGILRGVSVITEGFAKGHGMIVDSVTLEQVKACAETYVDGLRVKMDHYTGIDAMVGVLRDFVIDGVQLRADLHLLKSHDDFEKILEMAENMPGSFGLSISFSGESEVMEEGQVPSARCMEIYSADLVDQPAANPTGLFQVMSENPNLEAPAAPLVEEVKVEEITPETIAGEIKHIAEVIASEISDPVSDPVPEEESLVSKEQFEVKGPEGTQNLPEEVQEVTPEPVADPVADPEISEEEVKEVINSKLSAVVESFDLQKGEIISLRADLETAHRNLINLKAEVEKRDLQIASLEETKRLALKAVGLLPSDVELEISSDSTSFNPAEAYAAAVEAGDKQLAAELFKSHKKAIFAARNGN
jgi:hypothetical protein